MLVQRVFAREGTDISVRLRLVKGQTCNVDPTSFYSGLHTPARSNANENYLPYMFFQQKHDEKCLFVTKNCPISINVVATKRYYVTLSVFQNGLCSNNQTDISSLGPQL